MAFDFRRDFSVHLKRLFSMQTARIRISAFDSNHVSISLSSSRMNHSMIAREKPDKIRYHKTTIIFERGRFENFQKQNQREARYIGSSLKSFLIYWICFCIATLLLIQFCFHDYIFIYI